MKNNSKFGSRQYKLEVLKTTLGGFINLGFNFDGILISFGT
jgi:hypothetical protein